MPELLALAGIILILSGPFIIGHIISKPVEGQSDESEASKKTSEDE